MPTAKSYKILYVDDEVFNLRNFEAQFFDTYQVYVATNAEEALEIINREAIDLIVTDQRMPGVTGVELLKRVKARQPHIVPIMLTGFSDVEVVQEVVNEVGIFRYLSKPWKKDELKNTLNRAFEIDQLRRDNETLLQNLSQANGTLEELNQALERKVTARTEEISQQNDALRQQQRELEDQHQLVNNAQRTIVEQNYQLTKYAKNLEKLVQQRTRQLSKSNRELIRHNDQLTQFAFISAHNFRGPVASLLGLLNILDLEPLALSGEQLLVMGLIQETVHKLELVVDDLNDVLILKRAVGQRREVVNLEIMLHRVLRTLEPHVEATGAVITVDVSQAPEVLVIATHLEATLYELLHNALRFRQPAVPVAIHITTAFQENRFVLRVKDNGLGINLNRYGGHLFGLYQRFHAQEGGKGMGLFRVKTRVEMMGGEIKVNSSPNKGTEFIIFLPANHKSAAV